MRYDYGPAEPSISPADWLLAEADVHESFHAYQLRFRGADRPQADLAQYPRSPAEVHALALVEDQVLAQSAASADDARRILRTFTAIRATRNEKQPAIRAIEYDQERYEGTARYVQSRFALAVGQPPASIAAAPGAPPDLLRYLSGNRSYALGSAVGLLLGLGYGDGWRRLVADEASAPQAAAGLVGPISAGERDRLVADAAQRYG